ncbi:phage tail tape measure protein, partial [Paenibacillus sp. NPDC057967]|uniref:phage tail tape measure protein n=1 Tax=Paenibacillus sp. NPDC057967 TaxID=3346293 RepID=UPI0036DCB40F
MTTGATEIGAIKARLELDTAGFKTQIDQSKRDMTAMADNAKKASGNMAELAATVKKVGETQQEIGRLTGVLDNVNARIDIQRKKLSELKQSYDTTFNDSKKSKLQEQIVNTEATLLRLTKTSDDTAAKVWELEDSLKDAEKQMAEFATEADAASGKVGLFGDQTKSAVGKLSIAFAALTAATTAIIAKSVNAAATFESSMARVQAVSGATAAEFKALEDQALSLGATTVFTTAQVADGQSYLAIAGFDANEIIAAMPGLLDLAAAAQMDLGKAADITSNILTGFRLEASETSRVSDVLAKAFTSSNTSMEQLGYAMKYAAPIAAATGISIEDTAAAIGKLSDAGIQGEMAGTQLRAMLLRLVRPVGEAKDVMEQLGIKTADASGNILPFTQIIRQLETAFGGLTQASQAEAAAMIAGTEAAAGFLTLVSTGADDLDAFANELRDSGGTAQQVAETQMNTYNGALEEMKSALEAVGITVGNDFKPAMRAVMEEITKMLLGFNEMDDGTRAFIVTMTVATGGAGVLATGIYGLVVAMRALQASGIAANAALGWIGALSLVVGGLAGAFMSYKVEAEQAAEAQRSFNEEIAKNPMERTVEDVKSLKDQLDEVNVLVDRQRELRQKIAEQPSMAGTHAMTEDVRKATDATRELSRELSDVNAALKVFGIDTPVDASRVIAQMNEEINKSLPALRELRIEELRDIAAKQDQVTESERLIDRYNELRSQTERTADENEQLTRTVRQLSEKYPDLATELDAQGTLLITNEDLIRKLIQAEQDSLDKRLEAERENTESRRREANEALKSARKQVIAIQSVINAEKKSPQWLDDDVAMLLGKSSDTAAKKALAVVQEESDRVSQVLNEIDTELAAIDNGTWRGLLGTGESSPKSGTGTIDTDKDKKKKAEKTAEQLAQEAYRASLQKLDVRRLLGDLTGEQEIEEMAKLAETYKKFDAIWIDAETRRQRIISQLAAEADKAEQDRVKKTEEQQRDAFRKSADWVDAETRRMRERGESEEAIAQMQLESWARVRARYDKDSDYFKQADKSMFDARMNLRKLDEAAAKEASDTVTKSQRDLT